MFQSDLLDAVPNLFTNIVDKALAAIEPLKFAVVAPRSVDVLLHQDDLLHPFHLDEALVGFVGRVAKPADNAATDEGGRRRGIEKQEGEQN